MNARPFKNAPRRPVKSQTSARESSAPQICERLDHALAASTAEQLEAHVRTLEEALRSPHLDGSATHQFDTSAHTARPINVRQILKARRKRDEWFGQNLFADPAWDILLEVFAADQAQQKISVSAACIAAAVPSTTALRWLSKLEQAGHIVRTADHLDGRRYWVKLSPSATAAMKHYLAAISTEGMLV